MSDPIKCQQCDQNIAIDTEGNVTCGCDPIDEGPSCPDLILPHGTKCPICGWQATHVSPAETTLADNAALFSPMPEGWQIDGAMGYGHMAWSIDEPCDTIIKMRTGWVRTERYASIATPEPIAK